jgi:hypothetical protein
MAVLTSVAHPMLTTHRPERPTEVRGERVRKDLVRGGSHPRRRIRSGSGSLRCRILVSSIVRDLPLQQTALPAPAVKRSSRTTALVRCRWESGQNEHDYPRLGVWTTTMPRCSSEPVVRYDRRGAPEPICSTAAKRGAHRRNQDLDRAGELFGPKSAVVGIGSKHLRPESLRSRGTLAEALRDADPASGRRSDHARRARSTAFGSGVGSNLEVENSGPRNRSRRSGGRTCLGTSRIRPRTCGTCDSSGRPRALPRSSRTGPTRKLRTAALVLLGHTKRAH